MPAAPAVSRANGKKHTSVVTTGSPVSPGLPCAMVLTAYLVLSPVTGLVCHRRLADTSAKLDASVGASGPHDFAVRGSAPSSEAPPLVHRIPPRVRDDREPPLCGTGRGKFVKVICPTAQAKRLRHIGTTGKSVRHSGSRAAAIRNPFVKTTGGKMDSQVRNCAP